jgi:hypothetical protein
MGCECARYLPEVQARCSNFVFSDSPHKDAIAQYANEAARPVNNRPPLLWIIECRSLGAFVAHKQHVAEMWAAKPGVVVTPYYSQVKK